MEEKRIDLVEPAGHRRCHVVFMNGRFLVLDMQLEELLAAVRTFTSQPELEYLELPVIDVIGGGKDDAQKIPVVINNPCFFSRKAVDMIQSMSRSWVQAVPGQATTDVHVGRAAAAAVLDVRDSAAIARHSKVLSWPAKGRS